MSSTTAAALVDARVPTADARPTAVVYCEANFGAHRRQDRQRPRPPLRALRDPRRSSTARRSGLDAGVVLDDEAQRHPGLSPTWPTR